MCVIVNICVFTIFASNVKVGEVRLSIREVATVTLTICGKSGQNEIHAIFFERTCLTQSPEPFPIPRKNLKDPIQMIYLILLPLMFSRSEIHFTNIHLTKAMGKLSLVRLTILSFILFS